MIDNTSIQRVAKLHPKVRDEVSKILAEVDEVLTGNADVAISQGLRTFAEQDALYAQGRTVKGSKVTNAKGGQSIHNYGLAVDFVLKLNGKEVSWDTKKDFDNDKQADWMEVVAVFKKYGWVWGGDWRTFKDMPHFEKTFGHTWQTLLAKRDKGQVDSQGYVII